MHLTYHSKTLGTILFKKNKTQYDNMWPTRKHRCVPSRRGLTPRWVWNATPRFLSSLEMNIRSCTQALVGSLLPSVTRAHLQLFLESRMEDKTFVGQHKRKHYPWRTSILQVVVFILSLCKQFWFASLSPLLPGPVYIIRNPSLHNNPVFFWLLLYVFLWS